jgi:hypothetical protein
MRLSDAIRRGIRTFVQAFIGVILAQSGAILLAAQKGEYVLDIEWWKRIAVSGAAAGVIALFSYIQNALEDRGTVPALLKAPPSPGANPVPDNAGPVA